MRPLADFSTADWLRMLPLRHGLKQWRNDGWALAYLQRRPAGLERFLRDNVALHDGCVLLVIAFEQPWAIEWLLRSCRRNVPESTVMVFDNSRCDVAREAIRTVCETDGAPYLALPAHGSRHANRSHGLAMSWVVEHVVRALEPRRFTFIDHDLIPVRPLSLAEQMGGQPFYGVLNQGRCQAWQLWAGYCMYQVAGLQGVRLNFLHDFSQGLDTGGRNWRTLYRPHDARALRFAADQRVPIMLDRERVDVQVVDHRWVHLGGIGYNGHAKAKSRLARRLSERLDGGCPWESLLAAPGRAHVDLDLPI